MAYEDEPEDGWPILIRELFGHLRRGEDRRTAAAVAVAIDLHRGYVPDEIRARHALSDEEYKQARRSVRDALAAMRRGEAPAPV